MKATASRTRRLLPALLALFAACGDAHALETPETATKAKAGAVATDAEQPATAGLSGPAPRDIPLPEPTVELPELPYDKAELPGIQKLDVMITDSARLASAVEMFDGMSQAMKDSANTSLNGTTEDQIRGVMTIVDSILEFDRNALPFGRKARDAFVERYESDDTFGITYREIYSATEEALYDLIEDNVTRRATSSAMGNTYRYSSNSNVGYLESMLEEAQQQRAQAIQKVIRGAETDMMVAAYKKGQALVDLLQATKSQLELVRQLDPDSEALAAVMTQVDELAVSRQAAVDKARTEARFPSRYDGANAPSDIGELEQAMRTHLERSGYDVRSIRVASSWIAIRSALGIHLDNQVDFYVAAPSSIPAEADAGVIDVLYVTGKTGGPELQLPFATCSVGVITQMLEGNLE
jgi:hypothetical protein